MRFPRIAALLTLLAFVHPARADVVINEIFYHAPNDLDDLQFIELHNTAEKAADIAGWKLAHAVRHTFTAGTTVEPKGYLVVCKNKDQFKKAYGMDAAGQFEGSLSHNGETIELLNAQGKKVEEVKYRARAPWPAAADGYSASLERICPTSKADTPDNWAASPLPSGSPRPGGTPGKQNSCFEPHLPPVISKVKYTPTDVLPKQEITVEADVRAADGLKAVELRYRLAGVGAETDEKTVEMKAVKGRYTAKIPAQKQAPLIRFRIRAVDRLGGERFYPHPNDLRPALTVYAHPKFVPGKNPYGMVFNVGAGKAAAPGGGIRLPFNLTFGQQGPPAPPARGTSAFVYVRAKTGEVEVFDFINVTPRNGGRKVRFHRDRPLDGMTTINLIYEGVDRFILSEVLAYEVYRKAGNAACRTDIVRTWVDGQPLGFQLLIEQPNKAFLRRNKLNAGGNLYKCVWYGQGLVGTHEKKTHVHEGHDDLVKLDEELRKAKGEEQWEVIKKRFDVPQFATYYAVNMVLSNWDGYFNNHYLYHDTHGTGKWTIYPWDEDKTWGYHDGAGGENRIFWDMPLTFGAEGDTPPGWPKGQQPPGGFGFGAAWWRPGGVFSKPLLANPHFRKIFLARTKEITETVYTEEVFGPLIKELGSRMEEEFVYRAAIRHQDPKEAVVALRRNLDSLREHLSKRRSFLLAQDELKRAGKLDRGGLE